MLRKGKLIVKTELLFEAHELNTVKKLIKNGHIIELLTPVDQQHIRTPDMLMDGELWEMKSPVGHTKSTIERQLKRASRQSRNIVVDTSRTKMKDEKIVSKIKNYLQARNNSNYKKIILLDKKGKEQIFDKK